MNMTRTMNDRCLSDLLVLLTGFSAESVSAELLSRPIKHITSDSRTVCPGDVFLAIRTSSNDGVDYINSALKQGAVCCLLDADLAGIWQQQPNSTHANVIIVSGLSSQLGELASMFYDEPSKTMPVVGVTGTNGKSSCVHFLAQLASKLWEQPGSMIGTLGWGQLDRLQDSSHTTPDCIVLQRQLQSLHQQKSSMAAIEVSSHALLQSRITGTSFSVAAFTNLSQDHLDYHGTMQAYAAAKKTFFTDHWVGAAVVGVDDQYGQLLANELREQLAVSTRLITTSTSKTNADVLVRVVPDDSAAQNGLVLKINSPWGAAQVQTSLVGAFNAANIATCIACLGTMQLPFVDICAAIEQLTPVPGRMQCLPRQPHQPLVIVDYAHTPDALENALTSSRRHTMAKLWCVFGCGGERDVDKRPQMGRIAENLADRMVITSDNPRNENPQKILHDIVTGLQAPEHAQLEVDRASAIRYAIEGAAANDCVLIAGKGHEQYQYINGDTLPFDDVAIAFDALECVA